MSYIIDYELDDRLDIDTPERMKAAADETRAHICDLVLERAMSVTELAAIIGKSKGTIAHHVGVLADAGMLKVVRTRKVRAMDERFYGRTARTFYFKGDEALGGLPFFSEAETQVSSALMDQGWPTEFTMRHVRMSRERAAEFVERLAALAVEFSSMPRSGDVEHALLLAFFPTNRPAVKAKRSTRGRPQKEV